MISARDDHRPKKHHAPPVSRRRIFGASGRGCGMAGLRWPSACRGAKHHTAGPMVMACSGLISLGSRLFPTSVLTRTICPSVNGPTSISQPSGQLMQTCSRPKKQRSPPAQTCIQPTQPCGRPVEASGFLVQSSCLQWISENPINPPPFSSPEPTSAPTSRRRLNLERRLEPQIKVITFTQKLSPCRGSRSW